MNEDLKNSLLNSITRKDPLTIYREGIESAGIDGIVLDVSQDLVLINLIDDNLHLNGFTLLSTSDLTEVSNQRTEFLAKVLKARREAIHWDKKVTTNSLSTALKDIGNYWRIISIQSEISEADICLIGKLRLLTEHTAVMDLISPLGKWDGATATVELNKVTRVDFGGGYEEGLTLADSPS